MVSGSSPNYHSQFASPRRYFLQRNFQTSRVIYRLRRGMSLSALCLVDSIPRGSKSKRRVSISSKKYTIITYCTYSPLTHQAGAKGCDRRRQHYVRKNRPPYRAEISCGARPHPKCDDRRKGLNRGDNCQVIRFYKRRQKWGEQNCYEKDGVEVE